MAKANPKKSAGVQSKKTSRTKESIEVKQPENVIEETSTQSGVADVEMREDDNVSLPDDNEVDEQDEQEEEENQDEDQEDDPEEDDQDEDQDQEEDEDGVSDDDEEGEMNDENERPNSLSQSADVEMTREQNNIQQRSNIGIGKGKGKGKGKLMGMIPQGAKKKKGSKTVMDEDGKMKKKKKSPQNLNSYIYKVVKEVDPTCRISQSAMSVINSMMMDMCDTIATEAGRLIKHSNKQFLSHHAIDSAARLVMPNELARHCSGSAIQAVKKFLVNSHTDVVRPPKAKEPGHASKVTRVPR